MIGGRGGHGGKLLEIRASQLQILFRSGSGPELLTYERPGGGGGRGDHGGPEHGGAQHGGAQHGGAQHGGAEHGGRDDKGADELIGGRGGHQGGGKS